MDSEIIEEEKKDIQNSDSEIINEKIDLEPIDSLTNSLNIEKLNLSQTEFVNNEEDEAVVSDVKQLIDERSIEDDYEILNKNDASEFNSVETKINELKAEVDAVPVEEQKIIEEEPFSDILGNGSLTKRILVKGNYNDSRPKHGQICTISYKAKLENDTEVESNSDYQFILGDGEVVSALDIAVSLMYLNEESEIISESRHAYGEKGNLPTIPENAKLIFNVKLISFIDAPELNKLQPIERLSLAETKKVRGNFHYKRQTYDQAVNLYKKGLKYFYEFNLTGEESEKDLEKFSEIRIILLMNVALSNYKLELFNDALESLDDVLKSQPKHLKALFIKGKILMHVGELTEAIKFLTSALELDENNADIKKELSKAKSKYKIQHDKDKEMYQKMIAGVSDIKKSSNKSISNTKSSKQKANSNTGIKFSYLAATGIIVAVASITIAAFAKYKNLF